MKARLRNNHNAAATLSSSLWPAMLHILKRLFIGVDPLLRAIDRQDRMQLAYILSTRSFSVVCEPTTEGLDPGTLTQEQLLSRIGADAAEMNADAPISPKTLERDGLTYVLAFSHPRHLNSYCQSLAVQMNRIIGIPTYEVQGTALVAQLEAGMSILFNIGSCEECSVAPSDLAG